MKTSTVVERMSPEKWRERMAEIESDLMGELSNCETRDDYDCRSQLEILRALPLDPHLAAVEIRKWGF